MKSIRERLFEAFQVEYREHLEAIRALLDELGQRSAGSGIAQLDETFRRAHSLKGAARAVDLPPVEQIAHRLETLFAKVRDGQIKLDKALSLIINRVLDVVEDWVGAHSTGLPLPETADAVAAIEAVLEGKIEEAGIRLSVLAAGTASPPPFADAVPAPPPDLAIPEPESEPEPQSPPDSEPGRIPVARPEETVRVRAIHLDRLMRTTNELVTEGMIQRQLTQGLVGIDRQLGAVDQLWTRLRKGAGALIRESVESDRIIVVDRQFEALEQALRGVSREARRCRRMQQRTGWTLRQLGTDLQQEVREVRMVPADSLFGGFRKMVRDLARDVGKPVEVQVSGLDVEADRMVLQGLKDPVMHLLRNALSHGVERPEERVAAGKPPTATISLKFDVSDGRLVALIEDDGRGVDFEAIRRKAVERGLYSEADSRAQEQASLIDVIFSPGFSTARQVDELSGRGMGLSVVREAVTMMNGTVEVRARQPAGTCFRISLPLSVSSQRLFMVECQGYVYALPTEGIDRLYRVRAEDVKTVEGRSLVFLGECQMPLLSLAHLLGLAEGTVTVSRNVIPLMVLRNGDRRVAVAVDGFQVIRDGLVKDVGVPGVRGTMVAGGVLLEDGGIALVLNPFEIVETFRKLGGSGMLSTVERAPERRVPIIMVVDDSLTTRTLEKSILEAHGFQVRLAHDGLEALGRLRSEAVDLVISDVQMPRMDGFGLLAAIKADEGLKSIPVILVTSLEAREDRERGLSLGADAYVVKQKFDQKELLETIGQIL
ncbi:Histidine Sensor Kinase CheA3 [Candidatus Terasakiella magnetica]|nr:Histidine Sensor Kinase CheA3 [Candidatus Terasakiella magnetica]